MGNSSLRLPWRAGPANETDDPVLVSVTDFRLAKAQDLPGAYITALRLHRAWSGLEGAIGMWLWTEPFARRYGAVSVWQDEQALRRFVSGPVHVAIMRKYRDKGKLSSTSWHAERFIPAQAWQQATRRLAARELSSSRSRRS